MVNSFIINKLRRDSLLQSGKRALDLGCGDGKEALALSALGYEVYAVDSNPAAIAALRRKPTIDGNVRVEEKRIEAYNIEPGRYDCIIASNSIPFLHSKEEANTVIDRIITGLAPGGCAYISVFGTKDAWADRPQMNFWNYEEISKLLASYEGHIHYSIVEEGFGSTMAGSIKFWNIFKFIYVNTPAAIPLRRAA